MSSTLSEKLNLPKIDGTIIAYPIRGRNKSNESEYIWELEFTMTGPDSRFLEGKCLLSPNCVKRLTFSLVEAYNEMNILQQSEFSGLYRKIIERSIPRLEIVAENKKNRLKFYVESRTQQFYKELSINDVLEIIYELSLVEQKAENLIQTLKKLNS